MTAKPTPKVAEKCIAEFRKRPKYALIESSLATLFSQWLANDDLPIVHLKVAALNSMYSTQVYDTYSVAKHIHRLDIDSELFSGNIDLVERIASATVGGKNRFLLSFASKYCSWHMPQEFAIFDRNVEAALWRFRKTYGFATFRRKDLRQYRRFIEALREFSGAFGLGGLSRKELDQYLWIVGEKIRKA